MKAFYSAGIVSMRLWLTTLVAVTVNSFIVFVP
jgi:hypothetical protein